MSMKHSILGLSEPEKSCISWYFHTYEHLKFNAQLSWAWKKFYNLGPWFISLFEVDSDLWSSNTTIFQGWKVKKIFFLQRQKLLLDVAMAKNDNHIVPLVLGLLGHKETNFAHNIICYSEQEMLQYVTNAPEAPL